MKMMKMKMPSEGGSSLILGVFFDTGDKSTDRGLN